MHKESKLLFLSGLSLVPLGLFMLLAALGFARGWLNWETNGGPPFLGFVAAALLAWPIRRWYRHKLDIDLDVSVPWRDLPRRDALAHTGAFVLLVALLVAVLIEWYLKPSVRVVPVFIAFLFLARGLEFWANRKPVYGILFILFASFPFLVGAWPLLKQETAQNPYFGSEGVYELIYLGIALVGNGIMEHQILTGDRDSS